MESQFSVRSKPDLVADLWDDTQRRTNSVHQKLEEQRLCRLSPPFTHRPSSRTATVLGRAPLR